VNASSLQSLAFSKPVQSLTSVISTLVSLLLGSVTFDLNCKVVTNLFKTYTHTPYPLSFSHHFTPKHERLCETPHTISQLDCKFYLKYRAKKLRSSQLAHFGFSNTLLSHRPFLCEIIAKFTCSRFLPSFLELGDLSALHRYLIDYSQLLGYMLIYFILGQLPWQGITDGIRDDLKISWSFSRFILGKSKLERNKKIGEVKQAIRIVDLCKECPGFHSQSNPILDKTSLFSYF
jgi:hypothetical protein